MRHLDTENRHSTMMDVFATVLVAMREADKQFFPTRVAAMNELRAKGGQTDFFEVD